MQCVCKKVDPVLIENVIIWIQFTLMNSIHKEVHAIVT